MKVERQRGVGLARGLAYICVSLFLISGLLLFISYKLNTHKLELEIKGDKTITLEADSAYVEPGASSFYSERIWHRNDTKVDVKISGKVDTTKLGTYTVTYTAEHNELKETKTRTINVVDTTPPVIELKSLPDYYTLPGKPYAEEGFTATDTYDGDITANVTSEEKDGKVYYHVADSSGNTYDTVREIFYDDRDAPVITLNEVPVELIAGDPWEDSYSATDNVLGECTDRVNVIGEVNIYVPGTYVLNYSATDDYDNVANAERIVTVHPIPQNEPANAVKGEKIVFLTFDDGPGKHTERLLDILEKYNVKATFFVTAQQPRFLPLLSREANDGHTVALHTYSHEYKEIYASEEAFWEDQKKMNDIIEQYCGFRTDIMRFPGGSSNKVSSFNEGVMTRLTVQALRNDKDYYDWNVNSGDADGIKDPDALAENILAGIRSRNISVVLCHDIHEYTVDAMEKMIREALDDGYTFLPITKGCTLCHQTVNN